jgi:hypothetical protein
MSQTGGRKAEVVDTLWSPAYGIVEPAKALHYELTAQLPVELCVAVVPLREPAGQSGDLTVVNEAREGGVSAYRYQTGTSQYACFFARGGTRWTCGACESDAQFLCLCTGAGGDEELLSHNGTWAEISGRRFVLEPVR